MTLRALAGARHAGPDLGLRVRSGSAAKSPIVATGRRLEPGAGVKLRSKLSKAYLKAKELLKSLKSLLRVLGDTFSYLH